MQRRLFMFTAFQIRIFLDFSNGCLMLCDTEVPEVFCGMRRESLGQAEGRSQSTGHNQCQTKTGNLARKVSGNQGSCVIAYKQERILPASAKYSNVKVLTCNVCFFFLLQNDLTQLQSLIDKWRTVSQEAAERLLGKIHMDPQPTMGQLLSNLQVDKELIHYSEDDESFY